MQRQQQAGRRGLRQRLGAGLALASVAVLGVAACESSSGGAKQQGPVTITFANWASAEPATSPAMRKLIAGFEAANPGIKVTDNPIPVSDILHQAEVQCNAGDCPDVAEMQGNMIPTLSGSNLLAPLDSYASGFTNELYPSAVDLSKVNGKLYGVPWIMAPLALWYNRDLMKQAGLDPNSPPKTVDEFNHDMQVVKQKVPGVVPFGLDTTNRAIGLDQEWAWMRAFGADPIKDGKANADTPQMRNYLSWIRMLVKDGLTVPNKKYGEFRPIAAQGHLLFGYDGPYLRSVVESLNKQITDQQFLASWGLERTPAGADGKHYAVSSGHQMSIFRSSQHKDAAWKFIKYVISSKAGISDYTIGAEGAIPPEKSAISQYPALNNPVAKTYTAEVVPDLVRPPYGAKYEKAVAAIMPEVQRAFASSDPIDQIAKTMQQNLQGVYGGS